MPFEHIYRHHRRYRITEGSEEIQMRKVGQHLFGFGRQPDAADAGGRSAQADARAHDGDGLAEERFVIVDRGRSSDRTVRS